MLNLLTPYGIPEISIITGLAVAAIILITLNIVFIVRATRKPTEQDEHVTYVPVPAPVEEPQPEPLPQPVVLIADTTPEQEEALARLRLDRSFTAKLVQTEDETKELYAELKRELLSYNGVHARMSWRRETYSKSREALARFGVRGKTLCLYLALQPEEFADTKYKAEDVSSNNSFADTPLMYRIKNPLRMRYAKELIATLMAQRGLEKGEYVGDDPLADLGYRSTPALIEEGLIRVPAGMELPVFNEPVQEVQPEPVAEVVEAVEEPQPAEEIAVVAAITPEQEALMAQLRLDRSFTAKLVQTEDETKELYAELKRELLSYNGVHARMSWRRETYSKSREALARFGVRGKTLCLYLALQPEEFADTKYKAEDVSSNNSFADTPLMYRIKNPLRMRYAKELIATLMAQRGLEKGEYVGDDPLADLGYRSTPALIEEGLIRVPAGMELPVFNEPVQEPVQEVQPEPQPEPEPEPVVEAVVEEPQPAEEIAIAEAVEAEPEPEPVEAVAEEPQPEPEPEPEPVEVVEEPVPEPVEEVAEEPAEPVAEEPEPVEEPQPDPEPVPEPEPEPVPEHCIPVVGVAFPRRPNKLYWFDPDGKTWSKGEVALYVSPDGVKMEVVVAVELTERAESLLHLPLKPLKKLHS